MKCFWGRVWPVCMCIRGILDNIRDIGYQCGLFNVILLHWDNVYIHLSSLCFFCYPVAKEIAIWNLTDDSIFEVRWGLSTSLCFGIWMNKMDTKWLGSVVVKIAIWIVESYDSTYPKPFFLYFLIRSQTISNGGIVWAYNLAMSLQTWKEVTWSGVRLL